MKPIEEMSDKEFAEFFHVIHEKIMQDPLENFVKAPGLINFEPTPGQTVLLKNVFGQELDNSKKHKVYVECSRDKSAFDLEYQEFTEVELYKFFTGFDYNFTGKKFNRINLLCGRRGGKTVCASIIAIFTAIKINWKTLLKKTPVATVAVLSQSVEFSQEILDILREMVETSPTLARLKDKKRKDTQSTFHLKIPFLQNDGTVVYSCVAIKVGAASKKTTRGRAVCTLLADEACWWNLAENSPESDVDVFRAIKPALMQFGEHGTIIKLSSPAIKSGVMYNEWQKREQLKDEFIQLKAPSWMLNNILPKEEFQKEYILDPDGFDVEYRANFVDSISNFIQSDSVDSCIIKGVSFLPPFDDKKVIYSAAIDAAFKKDKFVFAVVGYNEHRITNHVMKVWEGSKANPVRAFEVAKYIRTVCKQFGLAEVIADQYAFQPLKEIFQQFSVSLVENTFSLPYKRKIYFALKRLIHSREIDLLDIPLLSKEIKELQVEQTATGQIRIGHPLGGSDDCADALAVASFTALKKAGIGIVAGDVTISNSNIVVTDKYGRAFTAPHPEMLGQYVGFESVYDNSSEWVKNDDGKWVLKSELEEEEQLFSDSGGNFIF